MALSQSPCPHHHVPTFSLRLTPLWYSKVQRVGLIHREGRRVGVQSQGSTRSQKRGLPAIITEYLERGLAYGHMGSGINEEHSEQNADAAEEWRDAPPPIQNEIVSVKYVEASEDACQPRAGMLKQTSSLMKNPAPVPCGTAGC